MSAGAVMLRGMRAPLRSPLATALALLTVVLSAPAVWAGAPAKKANKPAKATKKVEAPKLELGLGSLGGALPKAEGLSNGREVQTGAGMSPTVTTSDVRYEVVKIQHAYDFARTAEGAKPVGGPLTEIGLYGEPPSTPKFTTLVKVKASKPVNTSTSIELVILDPRGDTALSGNGELNFRGAKDGEVEWLIDWAPTARASGGDYRLLVRIAGQPLGTWPLKVVAEAK